MGRPRSSTKTAEPRTAQRKRGVIYARVSSQEQREEGYSLDAQLDLLRTYAERRDVEIVAEYIESETARKAGRRAFDDMCRLVKRANLESVIVEKTDRLYRNLRDRVTIDELDIEIHLVKENEVLTRDSRSHQKLVHDIKLVVAKNYCDNLSEEARKGMREKAKQGIWPTMAPLGYVNVLRGSRRIIEINPEEAPLVRAVFQGYATGEFSVKTVGAFAFALGLRSRSGKKLNGSAVHKVLMNPLYVGEVHWNGEIFQGTHEPIITREVWNRVQNILAGRSATPGNGTGGHGPEIFAYRGLMTCAACGCMVQSEIKKAQYIYYHCSGHRGCPRISVREEVVTEQVALVLEDLRLEPETLELIRRALHEAYGEQKNDFENQLEALRTQEAKLRKRLEQLYLDKVDGVVPAAAYPKLKAEWEDELGQVSSQIQRIDRANVNTLDDNVAMLELASNCSDRFKRANSVERREMFKSLVSNSQLSGRTVVLELRPWFKLIQEANERVRANRALVDQLSNWLPVVDSLRTYCTAA